MIKIGLCSVSFRKLSADQIINLVKENNLQAIEWGGDIHVPVGDFKLAKEIGNKTRKAGLLTYSYGSYFRSKDVNEFKLISETAKELGAKVIRIWAGEKSSCDFNEFEFNQLVNVIKECSEIAKINNQIICFEYHHHTYNDFKDSSLKLLKAIDKDNVKTYWQPQYWDDKVSKEINYKNNIESLKLLKDYIVNFHIYNWVGYQDRYSLSLIENEIKEYLSYANKDSIAYLEFFKNDDINEFIKDTKTLIKIVSK